MRQGGTNLRVLGDLRRCPDTMTLGCLSPHVGHVIIDGVINGDMVNDRFPQLKQERGEDGVLSTDAIADAFWTLHTQDPTAWSLELDLRPYKEQF